jgi:hypothetical protein
MTNITNAPKRVYNSSPVQLRINKRLYRLMVERAALEGQPVTAWIRFACMKELRRRKKPLPL